ncbi:MAG: TlpA family protein disulfide reductase [Phycisphaerales bacterium]|nr:TlpA family protein disulfide reductase [Phycisphaerales bacterium]
MPDGTPAAEAAISCEWEVQNDQLKPSHGAAFWKPDERKTNDRGEFSSILHGPPPRAMMLMAIDRNRTLGAIRVVPEAEINAPIELRLAPLVEMTVKFDKRDVFVPRQVPPPTTAPSYNFSAHIYMKEIEGAPMLLVARASGDAAGLNLKLPRGGYRLFFAGDNVIMEPTEFELRDKPVDVGTIRPKMHKLAHFIGKPPPEWNITAARGISKDTKLSDLRGKVVVVEFWGVGCGICVSGSLPELKKYVREHPAARDRLVVLAFHDPSMEALEALDNYLPKFEEKFWGKEPLPFPILLDSTGTTVERWGIFGYPSNVVIDAEGRVVQLSHSHHMLNAALDYLLKPPTAAPATKPAGDK